MKATMLTFLVESPDRRYAFLGDDEGNVYAYDRLDPRRRVIESGHPDTILVPVEVEPDPTAGEGPASRRFQSAVLRFARWAVAGGAWSARFGYEPRSRRWGRYVGRDL